MKKTSILYPFAAIALCAFTFGCQSEKTSKSLPVFDLEAAISRHAPDTFTWNGIAKSIRYIPLSTSDEHLVAGAQPVYIGKQCIWCADYKTKSLIRTDLDGEIQCSFSHVGQGPGEYSMLTDVTVNEKAKTVSIFDIKQQKLITYDFNGNLVREISAKEKGFDMPIFIGDEYAVCRAQAGTGKFRLYLTDGEYNIQKGIFPFPEGLTEMERMALVWKLNNTRNRNHAVIHFADMDTIYTATPEGLSPFAIFKLGAYKMSEEEARKLPNPAERIPTYLWSFFISDVADYLLVTYLREDIMQEEVWRKSDQQLLTRISKQGGAGLPLRLPNGTEIRIRPRSLYVNDNIAAYFVDAPTAIEGGIEGVDEDDNPVLVVMEL